MTSVALSHSPESQPHQLLPSVEALRKWNSAPAVTANNCYSFAVNHCFLDDGFLERPRPGETGGLFLRIPTISITTMRAALVADGLVPVKNLKAPSGFFLIAAVIKEERAYHFYRRDEHGTWWHKPNKFDPVTCLDFAGRSIADPRDSNQEYGSLIYDTFAGFYLAKAPGINLIAPYAVPPDT